MEEGGTDLVGASVGHRYIVVGDRVLQIPPATGATHDFARMEGTGVGDLDDDGAVEDDGNCVGEGSQSSMLK